MNDKLIRLWATKNKDDEWWSSFITSPLAIAVNYVVVDLKFLTPNKITILSFIVACMSAVFIILGSTMNFIIAAALIQLSHILDCMDGQMARYRNTPSAFGSFIDKITDQVQVIIWFGSVGYTAYIQSQSVLPIFLAFIGVSFYSLRGYMKYLSVYTIIHSDSNFLEKKNQKILIAQNEPTAGLGFDIFSNLKWFVTEQRKIFLFDEGVFIFMLSLSLIFNILIPMLWVFAMSQIFYGIVRGFQRGLEIERNSKIDIQK